ncbi:MAG: DEAD/DEAH box helicase [Chitinophagaceae bacterium]|nr:MAG: DEAD/DEAH box helicase [Chitinophagaceae bacterium]
MLELRTYQEQLVNEASETLASGHRKIICQLPTGGGKTVCFAAITDRYTRKSAGRVFILVHRIELLKQARRSLDKFFQIPSHAIKAGTRWIPDVPAYVGMVESANRRIAKLPPIGLVIIDEAHLNTFSKIHAAFPDAMFIGFTATPISANKKKPLKELYSEIVMGPQISQLIKEGALCQNITISPREVVNRAELAIKNGEFDMEGMARTYKQTKFVKGAVEAYKKHGQHPDGSWMKTLVFNVNVDHSKMVTQAFIDAGFPAAHLDGTETPYRRSEVLRWFSETPGAILNNCAILTAGFDEPSIEMIVVNHATMSITKWLQETGRGSRPTEFKSMFKILDLGGNAITHGDWNADRDWRNLFHNPKKPRERDQVAPCKSCPHCDAIIPAGVRKCPYCGYDYPSAEEELEKDLGEFVIVTRGINVEALMAENANRKKYYTFYNLGRRIAAQLLKQIGKKGLTDERTEFALQEYYKLAQEWCKKNGKAWNRWHGEQARETLYAELMERFEWVRPEMRPHEPEPLPFKPPEPRRLPPPPEEKPRQQFELFTNTLQTLQKISSL